MIPREHMDHADADDITSEASSRDQLANHTASLAETRVETINDRAASEEEIEERQEDKAVRHAAE